MEVACVDVAGRLMSQDNPNNYQDGGVIVERPAALLKPTCQQFGRCGLHKCAGTMRVCAKHCMDGFSLHWGLFFEFYLFDGVGWCRCANMQAGGP